MIINDNQWYVTNLDGEIFLWYHVSLLCQWYLTKLVGEIFFWYNYPCYVNDTSQNFLVRYSCGTSSCSTSKISHKISWWDIFVSVSTFELFIFTRSYAANRAADLDWIVLPGYSSGRYILGKNHENQPRTMKKPTWKYEKPWKLTWNHEKSTWNNKKTNQAPWKTIKPDLEPWKTIKINLESWTPTWNLENPIRNLEKP